MFAVAVISDLTCIISSIVGASPILWLLLKANPGLLKKTAPAFSCIMVETPIASSASSCVRIFPRQALNLFAKFLDQRATPAKVTIVDISRVGMGILVSEPKMPGAPCAVAFDVVVDGMPKRVNVWARIVYSVLQKDDRYRIGIQIRDCDAKSRSIIEGISGKSVMCGY